MELGFIGLGRMGSNMVLRLIEKKHKVIGYNRSPEPTRKLSKKGLIGVYSYEELIGKLKGRKIIWLMVPPGKVVDSILSELVPLLGKEDIIIDGGNSYYKDSQRRWKELARRGIYFLDAGVSGGPGVARNGSSIMVGGEKKIFSTELKIFKDLCVEGGCSYVGKSGAGHFVKGIHNGIEYGMLGAVAEGMNALKKNEKKLSLDIKSSARSYSKGSVIESKIVSWMERGINRKDFSKIMGSVPKGDTEEEMKKLASENNMALLKESIKMREKTREKSSYAGKVISVVRNEFGGHEVNKK